VKIVNRRQVQIDVVHDTWKVGRRNQRDDPGDNRVDPALWNDVSGETGYSLERRDENPNNWSVVASLLPNIVSYTDSGLIAGMQYFYRVRAVNSSGNSAWSNVASARASAPATATSAFSTMLIEDPDLALLT